MRPPTRPGAGGHRADVAGGGAADHVERLRERLGLGEIAGLLEVDEHRHVAAEHEILLVQVGVDDAALVERAGGVW